jgi:hypothetical protein
VNRIDERRRGPDQGHRDAADEQRDRSTPSDAEALAALRTIVAWLGVGPAQGVVYTQHSLPPDATSRDAYERRHRALRKAGIAGVWVRGKTHACNADAWATELPRAARHRLAVVAPTLDAEIDAALGIRTRAR